MNGREAYEKVIDDICHQGNANQNHNMIPLTLTGMAAAKKMNINKWQQVCGEIGTLELCWWGRRGVQPLWKTIWHFLKMLNTELRPSNSTPRRIPKRNANICSYKNVSLNVLSNIIHYRKKVTSNPKVHLNDE